MLPAEIIAEGMHTEMENAPMAEFIFRDVR